MSPHSSCEQISIHVLNWPCIFDHLNISRCISFVVCRASSLTYCHSSCVIKEAFNAMSW